MAQAIKNFYNNVAKKKTYWIPILFFAILTYGFAITNRTVSIDDLVFDHYLGSGMAMLSGARWGMVLWAKLVSLPVFTPFVNRFLCVCFLIVGASLFCCIAQTLFDAKSAWPYTIFTSVFITFPLINEIYEYDVANMIVGGNIALGALCILFQITYAGKPWKKVLFSSLMLAPIVSSYEAGALVYVSAVCIYLFCKYVIKGEKSTKAQWIREGLWFAAPLALAVVWRIVIGVLLIWIFGLSYQGNGAAEITWKNGSLLKQIFSLTKQTISEYVLNALVYFPITIFLFAAILFFIGIIAFSIKRHTIFPFILGIIVCFSLFFQSILQGNVIPYRTAQTISLFVAFVAALLAAGCLRSKHKGVRIGTIVISIWFCLHQGIYLSKILALNNQRSDNEIAVVHQIGTQLLSKYEKKPVVFVGHYDLGKWISSQAETNKESFNGKIYAKVWETFGKGNTADNAKPIKTNVNSLLNWSSHAFLSQNYLGELFSYCGYDIKVLEEFPDEQRESYNRIALKEGMKPFEIRDMGDYILVCIGEIQLTE